MVHIASIVDRRHKGSQQLNHLHFFSFVGFASERKVLLIKSECPWHITRLMLKWQEYLTISLCVMLVDADGTLPLHSFVSLFCWAHISYWRQSRVSFYF
jgi:hypothetical protein